MVEYCYLNGTVLDSQSLLRLIEDKGIHEAAGERLTGEEIRQKAQQDAEKQTEKILNRAQVEIERERDEAVSELRQQFASLTIMTAGKVIDKTLDKETHQELIEKALKESSELN